MILTAQLFFFFVGCNGNSGSEDSFKSWCVQKTDTLWSVLAETRKNFNYQMNEIAERREEMDSQLHILKFANGARLTDENKADILKFNSLFEAYKKIAIEYKESVLKAEDNFYRVKVLEKSVKNSEYDKKQTEFKKIWNQLKEEMDENESAAKEISGRLKSLEPMFLRLQPKMDKLVESLEERH